MIFSSGNGRAAHASHLPVDDVRVLIATSGQASRTVAFSVAPGIALQPRSLKAAFANWSAIWAYPSIERTSHRVERGVMLLNRVLTVRPGAPASHKVRAGEGDTIAPSSAGSARQPLV